jgi:hypothetical protein
MYDKHALLIPSYGHQINYVHLYDYEDQLEHKNMIIEMRKTNKNLLELLKYFDFLFLRARQDGFIFQQITIDCLTLCRNKEPYLPLRIESCNRVGYLARQPRTFQSLIIILVVPNLFLSRYRNEKQFDHILKREIVFYTHDA